MTRSRFSVFISCCLLCGVVRGQSRETAMKSGPGADARIVARCVQALTDVMVHDITSPPVAGRDYVYSLVAFYEGARPGDTAYQSFAGRLNGLAPLPKPEPGVAYDWLVAGAAAFHKTAYAFVFSKDL